MPSFTAEILDDFGCTDPALLRVVAPLLNQVQSVLMSEHPSACQVLRDELVRFRRSWHRELEPYPRLADLLNELTHDLDWILEEPSTPARPWASEAVPADVLPIPGMLHPQSVQYYVWLARTTEGDGAWVELGCWMGKTTVCLVEGLRLRGTRGAQRVHVFDGFMWHEWMDQHSSSWPVGHPKPRSGDPIRHHFEHFCRPYLSEVVVHCAQLTASPRAFGDAPKLSWDDRPLRVLVNDFWDDTETTRLTWEAFATAFTPGETLLVFNQYGNLRSYELRSFLRARRNCLAPLHKPVGPTKAFRYIG